MTVIGIISDTHGQLSEAAYAALADSDHIIHAGDIGNPPILRELETLAGTTTSTSTGRRSAVSRIPSSTA